MAQQSQNSYYPQNNQPQGPYPSEFNSYGPPPYTEHNYSHNEQYGRSQFYDTPQHNERPAEMPQNCNTTQFQNQPAGANASYYNGEPLTNPNDPNAPKDERGLGSTVVGGAAGGYAGHKMGGGWSTAAGAAIGAVGMNVISHRMKPQPAPVQQVVAVPQPVQYVAAPGVTGYEGMGLLGQRRARLAGRVGRRGLF